jgi:putative FmdB family regulatory protein
VPIYEYLCEDCGRITELMQKMTDPAPRKCPECGSKKIAKLVSRSAFQLKGGGWYSDLYSSKKKEAKPADGDAKPSAKDGKPAAAAAAAPVTEKPGTEKKSPPEKKKVRT